MKKNLLTLIFSIIFMGSIYAQNLTVKLNSNHNLQSSVSLADTIKILAVMVNFQPDKDDATFGNGKFGSIYSKNYGSNILDPLPHDKDYFESHLTFVNNYYQKVSSGKANVIFTILPDTFSVSKTMRNYSLAPGSDDFTPVGDFSKEVWIKVAQNNPTINFSDYDIFLIFHAGVGRDISLPGSIGNERDLPSVYLNDTTLKEIFNNQMDGLPVNRYGKYNSMIIPETESRELQSLNGIVLFEITINGLLVASVASHLGLPDLFDTETGLSAIGRFGLMDGQSIFAYNGCFPSEPSAWEKIYLGWSEAADVSPGNYNINLSSKLAASLADTVILKMPINSNEYYLIENRQRDVSKDGAKITYKSNGSIFTRTFLKDTAGFYSYDTDSLKGVIIDVDEYDWALPGNGIVIWHIDDGVINEKLATNKINNDKKRRGVDVEEADGIQDIGETFTTILGDQVIGEGTEQDFWYSSNKANFFKNKFDKNTRPDTKTNTGANSLITIKSFSAISNKMSFKTEYGDSSIKPIFSSLFNNLNLNHVSVIEEGDSPKFAFIDSSNLLITDGTNILENNPNFNNGSKVASTKIGDKIYVFGYNNNKINYWINDGASSEVGSFEINHQISTVPVIRKKFNENYDLIFGTEDGIIFVYDLESVATINPNRKDSILIDTQYSVDKISASSTNIFAIANSNLLNIDFSPGPSYYFSTDGTKIKFESEFLTDLASSVNSKGKTISAIVTSDEKINLITDGKIQSSFELSNNQPISSISLADIKQDGENYILINNGNQLEAYNLTGAMADNFPVLRNATESLTFAPLAADIEGDSKSEIITTDLQGNIFAFDGGSGKLIDGFPISFGNQLTSQTVLFNYKGKTAFAGFDANNKFSAWTVSPLFTAPNWAEENGNAQNNSFTIAASKTNTINEFFPTARAYNYPNPVYDGQTAIRYFVNEDSKINIKIFDIAGDYVAELNNFASGGFDNETIWNVGNIQSGVYLARIEANGLSGKTESVIIKIAVVK